MYRIAIYIVWEMHQHVKTRICFRLNLVIRVTTGCAVRYLYHLICIIKCVFFRTGARIISEIWCCHDSNSLAPGKCGNDSLNTCHGLSLWTFLVRCSQVNEDTFDEKSILVHMAWCRQVTSHIWTNGNPDVCPHISLLGHDKLTKVTAIVY